MPTTKQSTNQIDVAVSINAAHESYKRGVRTTLTHAIEAGRLLRPVKKEVGHGKWQRWVEMHLDFSARTAQLYMRCYRYRRKLAKPQGLSLLTDAIKRIQNKDNKDKDNKDKDKDKDNLTLREQLKKLNSHLVNAKKLIEHIEKKRGEKVWARNAAARVKKLAADLASVLERLR